MIGQIVTDPETGVPLGNGGKSLAQSTYNPPYEVKKLFARVQRDFQTAWNLQNKPLDEFDGHSLLQRAKLDQQTFAAFVGLEYLPKHKQWKWRGRKNTARNKLISILAHMISSMLYPFVYAQNEQDEEDKMTAKAMRILVEEKLRKANYEQKFFYAVLCALVNPAVFVGVEYVELLQAIRQRNEKGEMSVEQVVDEALSGLMLHIIPIDEILLGDLYTGTGDIPKQPFIFRLRRITYDMARAQYGGKYFLGDKDLFDFVEAGKTRCCFQTAENQNLTLFDIEWDDADANFVQELTVLYKGEDLELTWVGGVGMFNHLKPYDNPMSHRRMTAGSKGWYTAPVYPVAMTGFEPIDPQGRFVYFKSGAFKEYWEDLKITEIDRLMIDGLKLDIFKPMFISGVAAVDQTVMVPGATVSMPKDAKAETYSLGPNLVAAFNAITEATKDMSESTTDKIMAGQTEKGITATQTLEARKNARIFLGVFGFMIANLVKQVGELVMDCVILYDTVGELEEYAGKGLSMKFKRILVRGKEKGKNITNKIIFTDKYMGRKLKAQRIRDLEWDLFNKTGGADSDQRIWEINPYKFARTRFSMFVDADQIISRSMGTDKMAKQEAFEKLMDPRVLPFIDAEAVVTDLVIEEYSDGDPDRFKKKQSQDELVNTLLGQVSPQNEVVPGGGQS